MSTWIAGSTYAVVARWDRDNTLDGTNYLALSVNDSHFFGGTSSLGGFDPQTTISLGSSGSSYPANAIIEGLTIYRRPLFDGQYGIDVGNGDEIAQIYNSGTGKDPTLVTGSWDVVFALPTNASTGTLATGTGNAWSHPHASNLLYTSTTNTGGFMMGGDMGSDGFGSVGASSPADVSSIEFNGSNTDINTGSDASIDNMRNGAMTVEGWYRIDGSGFNSFISKGASYQGWEIIVHQTVGVEVRFWQTDSTTTTVSSGLGNWTADGKWHHIALTYDNNGDKKIRLWIDGVIVGTSGAVTKDQVSDSSRDLRLGNGDYGAVDGSVGWVRISNSVRYSSTFSPASRFSPPTSDANTVAQWNMTDGTGTTVTNVGNCGGVASNCNGTLSNGTWNQGGALSTNQKIFSGGYKFTSNAANQGIFRSFSATNGGDYVLRALGHSDGTCNPQVKITRADGTTEISHLNGTTTSTRTDPDVYIFTWESPAAEANQVQLINTAASGTCYWHQVEVLTNKINKSSFEGGFSGTPLLPSGWCSGNDCDQGYSPIENGDITEESTIVHSGQSSLRYTSNFTSSGDFLMGSNAATSVGTYYSVGGFSYGNGSVGAKINSNWGARGVLQHTGNTGFLITGGPAQHWSHFSGVMRMNSTWDAIGLLGSGGDNIYADDIYMFVISPVSLTVTPANQANSTVTSGLRVDGADTLTQPITGLSTDRGVIKFKFTPRHSWSTAASFGISDPHIFSLGSGSNWISLWRVNSSNLRLDSNFNGSYYTPQWTNPVLNAGETYDIEISYAINNAISLKVNGNIIAFQAMGNTPFSVVPTQIYWGGYSSGKQYDATISNFIALTPTENTTAPYYKFGSKSVKLVNAGTMPDEYTIAIDPNSTATHTLSAYVYDGTSGNVGGTVASSSAKLVFGGSVVTPTSYTDMGGGWWRLTYSATTTDASLLYGVQAQAGKTLYVDGIQLEQKSYATTYADGSLGTGYSWSGTANESTGVRALGQIAISNSEHDSTKGSYSFWFRPNVNWSIDYSNYALLRAGTTTIFGLLNWNGNKYMAMWGGLHFHSIPNRNEWVHEIVTYNADQRCSYKNGSLIGCVGGSTVTPGDISLADASVTYSDLRIYNQALTPSEVSALYQQGLATHTSGSEGVGRYQSSGTYISPVIDLGANGAWGVTPWSSTQTLNDGTVTYFTRTSPDNTSWSSWEQVLGSAIASAPRRYMQWKANMVANELKSQTPKVTGMTVAYVEDTTPPVNPADLALGYTSVASASATLVSGNYHNFPQPKFTWSAAEDDAASGQSASGVATYHLLMTTDAGATPSAHMSDPCYQERDSDTRSYIVGTAPAACTLTDNTWYLRLQAKDHSGNISSPVTLFVYKYDGTVPDAPAAISSTSVGYSATNSFTFFWPVAQDRGANASGITHYQYKTGATEGVFSEWQDSNVPGESIITQIGGIQAYQQGQNFFFVRSVDRAGNVSAVTTNVAVAPFYYNADAPTAPQNIVISPATSSNSPAASNVFSVSWEAPETYSGEIAKYYYCVNCTPSATTMTETTSAETVNRVLSTMALATQQGKNTFYLVAEDNNINVSTGHGNRNFEAYASAEFYASTIAPGAPSNLTVSDASDRDASVWRLTLAWKAAATGGTPARYDIYRSTTGDTYALLGNTSSTAYTDADLAQGTIYYYKVRAVDNAGSNSVFSNVVNLAPEGKYTEPPAAGGDPTVSVGSTTATVEWVTSRATFGTVEYGKSTTYGSATAETVAVTNHMLKLKGLAPGTTYHYRVQSLDDSALVGYDRGSAYTKDYTFTTLTAPLISKVEVNDIGLETAVISWTAASLESAVIEYGETTAYGTQVEVSVGEKAASHSTRLSGLNHSTTYHMRIKGVDIDGNDLVSDDYSFQTIVFPRITAVVLNTDQEESGTTAVLAWASNVPTYGVLEYQIAKVDPEYARTSLRNVSNTNALMNLTQEELAQIPLIPSSTVQKVAQTELAAQHVERIAGLSDGSLYIFTIRGKDKYGNETVSDPIRYVTGADTRPPRINNLVFETPVSGTGAQATAQIIVSWETDEPAFAQVAWGEGNGTEYPRETERSESPATKHVVVLRDLRPTSSYHLKIIVEDKTGNVAESEDTVVVTPSAQQAAFDIIIRNLEDVFGFLNL